MASHNHAKEPVEKSRVSSSCSSQNHSYVLSSAFRNFFRDNSPITIPIEIGHPLELLFLSRGCKAGYRDFRAKEIKMSCRATRSKKKSSKTNRNNCYRL